MTDQRVIDFLNSRHEGHEAARVTTYTFWSGGREVEVRVYDRGEDAGAIRYSVWADWAQPDEEVRARGGYTHSLGNADSTLEGALFNVHWNKFEPREDD